MGSFTGALGTLFVEIDARVGDAISAFDQIESKVGEVEGKFAGMERVGQQMAGLGAGLTAGITAPLVGLASLAIDAAGEMDSLMRGLTAVSGSSDEAAKQMDRLKEVAKLPGLGLEEAVQGSIRLQAVGVQAQDAERYMKAFGNAIATVGGGRADLDAVLTQLTQMSTKTKVVSEDLRPVMERVPQVASILKDAYGTIDTEALQKAGLTTQEVIGTIIGGLEKLPPVTGGIKNAMENLKDSASQSLTAIGNALTPVLTALTPMIESFLAGVKSLAEWFTNLPGPAQAAIGTLVALAAALGPVLLAIGGIVTAIGAAMPALTGLAGFFGVSVAALAPWALAIGAVLAALVALGVWISANWEPITATLRQAWEGIQELWSGTWDAVSSYITGVWGTITGAVDTVWQPVVSFFSTIWDGINTAWDAVWGAIGGTLNAAWGTVTGAVRTVWEPIASFFSTIWDGLIRYFGGIWDGIASGLTGVWDGIKSAADRVWNAIGEAISGFIEWAKKIPGVNKLFNLDDAWKSAGKLKEHTDKATGSVKSFGEAAKGAAGSSSAPVPKLGAAAKETGKSVKEAGEAAETAESKIKPLRETSELLLATQKLLNAEHKKHVEHLAASQLEASKWKDWVQQMIAPADDLFDSLKAINGELTAYANTHGPAALAKITEINAKIPEQTTAVTNLGTASKTAYTDIATHAGTAHAAVKGDPSTVGKDAISLSFKGWKETATDLKTAVPSLIDGMLGDLGTTITNKLPSLTGPFGELKTAATGAIGTFVTDAAKMLFDGDASWGEKLKSLLGTIGNAVKNIFVEPAKTALNDLMNGVLKDLISSDTGFSGLQKSIRNVGDVFKGIFGKGGEIEEGAKHAGDVIDGVGGNKPSGGAPGGGGGGGGAGAAASGLTGWIGAISGAVTAISSVIGNFQMAGMNKTLDLIERYTRYSEIHLQHILEDGVNKWLPKLDQINGFLWETFIGAFASLMSTTEDIRDVVKSLKFPIDWTMNFTDMNRQTLYEIRDALYDISGYLLTTRDNTTSMKDKLTGAQTWTVQFAGDPIASMIGNEIMRQLRLQGVNLV